ncbi:hypothetical protein JL721_8764 [Aureococcus anophagefferens]|nr:hypothetical protein JL721_8764 [Aureococcus anophagefferens]
MSTLSAARADNFYYPPNWDPSKESLSQHTGDTRGRNQYEQEGLIRFELPFDGWCEGCGRHVGKGVRFNAKKDADGKYHSTTVWKFTMQCPSCTTKFVIKTDPAKSDYDFASGIRRKVESYAEDAADGARLLGDTDHRAQEAALAKRRDPMATLERTRDDTATRRAARRTGAERFYDDYGANRALRKRHRAVRKDAKERDGMGRRLGLAIELLPPHPDDASGEGSTLRARAAAARPTSIFGRPVAPRSSRAPSRASAATRSGSSSPARALRRRAPTTTRGDRARVGMLAALLLRAPARRPVEPFGGELEVEAHKTLRDIFAPGTWRIDGCRERKSVNHDKILADIEASGKDSAFAAAVCPFSGVTALHACAINGYLSLLKVLVEKCEMSPLVCAGGLSSMMSSRLEHVRGADAMWMAKRRGHKHVIEYMKTLPIVKQATVSLEKQLVVMEAAHKEAVAEAKERAVEEAARKAEEEARLAAEEKKRKEKEKAQRKMRDEIQAFDGVLRAKKKALMDPSYAFKLAETGQAKAMELLEDEKQSHKQDTNRCKAMRNRAEDNEIGAEMKKPEQLIADIDEMLNEYIALWELDEQLEKYVAEANDTRWGDLVPEELEENAKKLTSKVKKLPKPVKTSEAFKVLDRRAKEFYTSCPLILSLHTPCMKKRHWDELLEGAHATLSETPIENPNIELSSEILSLELHRASVAAVVEEVTDKAVKEAKQEETLETLEVNWSGIVFVRTPYDKDESVPLLKMDEKDFEQLESDLLTLQSMVSSRYEFFKERSTKWQAELQNVGEVIAILAELQRMWSYLEPLFVGSDEVKRELPETAAKFAEIDATVRSLLKEAWETKNVKAACNKEGLIPTLEDITVKQDMCKKSLNEFLDSKRMQFARFYFASDGRTNGADAGQIGLLIAAIYYTKECEDAMEKIAGNGDEAPYVEFQTRTLVAQLSDLILLTKGKLDGAMRTRVMCMITYDAHSRDMIEKTLRTKAYQISSFQWQSQLKMRFDESQNRWLVHILNAEFDYGFEYLGNGPRLVVTPLTDRVYVTATQALNLCMGCAPAGPAGTGKTESTKDLASALGKCCYFKAVCNGVKRVKTARKVARKSGSPFDEAARMTTIEGDLVKLDETCGAFITMNPGYLGRSELPEGLKALFRPMTVMVPDLVMICENMLMAQGFVSAKSLASKFYSLYSLLKDLLSKQEHYDWGLRAIKSVLVVAGMLLRTDPDSDEDNILMRALRDFNIAKIVKADEVVFFGLLNDLFPGLDPPRVIDKTLEQSVEKAVEESGQFGDDVFKLKCVQLDELIAIRHCVFVMGPPGSFKTSCWKMLANAYKIKDPDNPVKVVDINPKTMPTQDLYGYINMVTRDWKDGLLSTIMRDLGQIDDEKPKWILLDGDLDANWIESMNSVMDDNRLLTLASNERIPLKPHMRMIFEIRDLKYATPATVSRAGILYISTDEGFQWRSMINTWVSTRSGDGFTDESRQWLTECFDEYVGPSLKCFRKMLTSIPQFETTLDYKRTFSEWWKKQFRNVQFPTKDTVFDYWLDTESMSFESWKSSPAFSEVAFNSREMNMSDVTANLEVSLQKKTGSLYGPPGACHMVYFIDDLNLPELDKYNTQSAIALVRQHLDYTHWYDITKLALKTVEKCQYVAAMNPTAGSFHVNPRLQRHFTTFAVSMPSDQSLGIIYETFLSGHINNVFTNTAAEMMNMLPKIIKTTLLVHKDVSENFRKTATNFHYEFNIRHVAGVFQGLLMTSPAKFGNTSIVADCWLHECYRVYGDRLVSPEDLAKFDGIMAAQAKKGFGEFNLSRFYGETRDPLTFCHFIEGIGEDPIYDQIHELAVLQKILDQALEEYNESNAQMDLVLFEDALNHICRITRIINNPQGHALLVGVGGSGKKSLSRLSSFICGFQTTMIQISATYGINDLKVDLQAMYNRAGVKSEGVMFLFTDAEITNERFLVYLNDLLGSADIADLYAQDEKDTVINSCMKKAKAAGFAPGGRARLRVLFAGGAQEPARRALLLARRRGVFRMRCRKFPALVNCTVIDWFQPWPKQALYSVGCKFLAQIEDLGGEEVRQQIENFMPYSFDSTNKAAVEYFDMDGRYVYTTPKSYLELLKLYATVLDTKRAENDQATKRLKNGVQKLEDCTKVVDVLKEEIAGKVADAEEKKATADGIAKRVKAEKEVVEMESENASIEEKKVTKIAAEVTAKQQSAEADLAKAVPAVEAAMAALDTLDVKQLQMCKTMAKPPPGVDDVFSACLVLLAGLNPAVTVQKSGKKFVDELKSYKESFDGGKVPLINFKEVRFYLAMEHFQPDIIMGKNSAAAGLCNWCINIVVYYDVVSMVEPKKKLVAEATIQLQEANHKLEQEAEKVKNEAEEVVAKGQMKLGLAERLLGALSSENVRWCAGIESLGTSRALLVGDTLLSAAFISYIGPFTKQYRTKLLEEQWVPRLRSPTTGVPVPMSKEADPLTALTTDSEIALWQTMKLPADPVSTENGAIVSRSTRWPLLIDPQLQGVAWVKTQNTRDKNAMLRVSRLGTKDLLKTLKECLVGGFPMLVENMGEQIEASIMPAVQRAKMRRGGRYFLKLGEDEVEYHANFRMFLHTKLSNPHYPPEIQAECTLVNFTAKLTAGRKTTESINNTSEKFRLVARRGSQLFFIMNDLVKIHTYYIYSLNAFVVVFLNGIDQVQRESKEAEEEAKPKKKKGFGLKAFKKIAKKVIGGLERFPWNRDILMNASHSDTLDSDFLDKLMSIGKKKSPRGGEGSEGTFKVGDVVEGDLCVGTVRKLCKVGDVAALVLETKADPPRYYVVPETTVEKYVDYAARCIADDKLDGAYLGIMLGGREAEGEPAPVEASAWLPEATWPKLRALQEDCGDKVPMFGGLLKHIEENASAWEAWYNHKSPETETPPLPEGCPAPNLFEMVLLLCTMRSDRVTMGVTNYIASNYGDGYVHQPPFDMKKAYQESTASTPIFFVLFPGVDPTLWVESLGESFGITAANHKFVNISMGQGQEAPAEAMLEKMAHDGGWVMLQNLHLMQSWLPVLERKLEVCSEHAHQDFRCYVSAEAPSFSYQRNIPESLLQSCIKVSNEAPSDIKSNIERAWAPFPQARLDECTLPLEFRSCLFGLCFFHSVMLGRKRFGQQGWSRKYGFNMGDLTICADVLQTYLDDNGRVPWDDLRYIFGEIMYGGHITDFWDRRTNNTYLEVSFTPSLLAAEELGEGFNSPDPATHTTREMYVEHLKTKLPPESPLIYGLHMNSEIAYLNSATTALLSTILRLKAGSKAGGGGGGGSGIDEMITDLIERLPEPYDLIDINEKAAPLLKGKEAPYIVVVLQEVGRMNGLCAEMGRTLEELRKGLLGQLNMSELMEELMSALLIKQVPGRNPFHTASWEKYAWPSMKGLLPWFADLIQRCEQLTAWSGAEGIKTPTSVWLPGLFNPTAFLTAIKQVTARNNSLALDKMSTETHVSAFNEPDEITERLTEGAYIHGMFCEGACWGEVENEAFDDTVDSTQLAGILRDSRPKELLPHMPIIYIKAVQVQPTWEPSAVGYLRPEPTIYNCPVFRGPTFVFVATLKTDLPASKWVLRGVALVAQLD